MRFYGSKKFSGTNDHDADVAAGARGKGRTSGVWGREVEV